MKKFYLYCMTLEIQIDQIIKHQKGVENFKIDPIILDNFNLEDRLLFETPQHMQYSICGKTRGGGVSKIFLLCLTKIVGGQ